MTLRSQNAADTQYLRNIDSRLGPAGRHRQRPHPAADQLTSVRTLVVQSRNGALGSASQSAIAADVTAIRGDVIDLYNTTYLDRPVFGGTVTATTAIDANGNYLGNDQPSRPGSPPTPHPHRRDRQQRRGRTPSRP